MRIKAVSVVIPIKTISEANARGKHWAPRALRTKSARGAAKLLMTSALNSAGRPDMYPAAVTLIRISSGTLDDDNLRGALKGIRDGIADALGIDDRDPRVTWHYGQCRGKRGQYAVEVTIQTAERLASAG